MTPCLFCGGDRNAPNHWATCDGRQGAIDAQAPPQGERRPVWAPPANWRAATEAEDTGRRYDLAAARAARDRGIATVDRSDTFAADADLAIRIVAARSPTFIVDDVWRFMPAGSYAVDNRAMGAAMVRAFKGGIITSTDEYRASAQRQCHANPRRVWASRIFSRE